MLNQASRFRAYFTAKIGRCERCMQQSLALALAAWGGIGIGLLMWPDHLVQQLIGVLALGLTALWMLHVAVYAVRALAEARRGDQQPASPDIYHGLSAKKGLGVEFVGRRHALGVLLRAASIGAVASVPVFLWSSEAFAFCGQCTKNSDCGSSNSGWCCKNTAPVNAGYVCNECKKC